MFESYHKATSGGFCVLISNERWIEQSLKSSRLNKLLFETHFLNSGLVCLLTASGIKSNSGPIFSNVAILTIFYQEYIWNGLLKLWRAESNVIQYHLWLVTLNMFVQCSIPLVKYFKLATLKSNSSESWLIFYSSWLDNCIAPP